MNLQKRMFLGILLLTVLVALPTAVQARPSPTPKYYTAQLSGRDIESGPIQVTNGMSISSKPPLHGCGAITFNTNGQSDWNRYQGTHTDAELWIQCKPTDGSIAISWGRYEPEPGYYSFHYYLNGYGISFVQDKATKIWTATLEGYPFIIRDTTTDLDTEYTVYLTFKLTVQ